MWIGRLLLRLEILSASHQWDADHVRVMDTMLEKVKATLTALDEIEVDIRKILKKGEREDGNNC